MSVDVSATFFILIKIVKKLEPLFILKDAFITLAIESWRLSRFTEELIQSEDRLKETKYERKIAWFNDQLEETLEACDLRLVNLENSIFDLGMPVKAINISEFKESKDLIIIKMLEPVVMCGDRLERSGTVLLADKP
tara:strand:+ start:206 stop:616 length:411 start_codon:yes stop_codon:yes gene_type:complete